MIAQRKTKLGGFLGLTAGVVFLSHLSAWGQMPMPTSQPASAPTSQSTPASTAASQPIVLASSVGIKPDANRGKREYARYCVWCHGASGNGNGTSAQQMLPRPHDFTSGSFMCRSTPSGSLPTDDDLRRDIRLGAATTGMPSWVAIGPVQIDNLIAQIKHFSPRWQTDPAPVPIVVPPEPPSSPASVTRGRAVYEKMRCATCHGEGGKADGPAISTLRDDMGNPTLPADLTVPRSFKCGDSSARVYTTLMTGIDMTPMPSYDGNLSTDEAWDLVHYVAALGK